MKGPICAIWLASACVSAAAWAYEGSAFETVRAAVLSDPYDTLPRFVVSDSSFGPSGDRDDNRLLQAGRRTLTVGDDLLEFPHGQKLFQPNGICFIGQWRVTGRSEYTGFFKEGAHGLIIMRASVSLSQTTRGHRRAFALAGKLFPTLDPAQVVRTANFFAMENVAGTEDEHFLDAILDNNPRLSGLPRSLAELAIGLRVRRDFARADRELSGGEPRLHYRPLYPIAELGLDAGQAPVTPMWMQLRIAEGTPRIDADDFRDELRLSHYPGHRLQWEIRVAAAHPDGKSDAAWRRIGEIVVTEDAASRSCDARLHFAHPVVRH